MPTERSRSSGRAVLAAMSLLTLTGVSVASEPLPLARPVAAAMERVRAGAARRLQADECRRVLSDFIDAEGHRLQESLRSRGLSAAEYLQTLTFVDGSSTRSCRLGGWVLLVARPGSGYVGVCPVDGRPFTSRLAQVQLRNPTLAESIVIHEMLHTLGLGENPPTSEEITRQVQRRCGS